MGIFDIIGKKKTTMRDSGVLQGAADRHTHILFGVDDGIRTLEDALAVLAVEEAAGISDVWCTPHVMEDMPNTTKVLKERFLLLKAAYKGNIRLHLAAEYMIDTVLEERLKSGDLLTMEDEILLVETSTVAGPIGLHGLFQDMMRAGYRPLFAHPERYRYLKDEDYEKLHEAGVRFQLNLPSLLGYYGEAVRSRADWILTRGWYNAFGSDCHRIRSIADLIDRKALDVSLVEKLKEISLF